MANAKKERRAKGMEGERRVDYGGSWNGETRGVGRDGCGDEVAEKAISVAHLVKRGSVRRWRPVSGGECVSGKT